MSATFIERVNSFDKRRRNTYGLYLTAAIIVPVIVFIIGGVLMFLTHYFPVPPGSDNTFDYITESFLLFAPRTAIVIILILNLSAMVMSLLIKDIKLSIIGILPILIFLAYFFIELPFGFFGLALVIYATLVIISLVWDAVKTRI